MGLTSLTRGFLQGCYIMPEAVLAKLRARKYPFRCTQTPCRIQEVEPPNSTVCLYWVIARNILRGSTLWILARVCEPPDFGLGCAFRWLHGHKAHGSGYRLWAMGAGLSLATHSCLQSPALDKSHHLVYVPDCGCLTTDLGCSPLY